MKKRILFLLMASAGCVASGSLHECTRAVADGAFNAANEISSPYQPSKITLEILSLKRSGKVRLRGLATRFQNGAIRLSITPYVLGAGHALMDIFTNERKGAEQVVEKQWAGELEFNNGVLLRANCTSGHFHKSGKLNDPAVLEQYLASEHRAFSVHNDFHIEKYHSDSRHLDQRLNKVLILTAAKPDEGFMHQIANLMTPIVVYSEVLDYLLGAAPPAEISQEMYASNLLEIPNAYWEIFETYRQVLREDGVEVGDERDIEDVVDRVKNAEPIAGTAFAKYRERLESIRMISLISTPKHWEQWWVPYEALVRVLAP